MCYYWGENGAYIDSKAKNKPKVLDFNIVKNLIKDLAPITPNYSLFGGEPLLYPYFEELIDEIKKYKSFVDTPTNGTLLFDKAELMVNKEFDLVRVSIDGPQEINDNQRGLGSYEKAINGINHLFELKEKRRVKKPLIDIIYTVTPDNYKDVEQFFLQDINISQINQITIQMQNYLTNDMGERYAKLLISEFGIQSDNYWRGIVQSPSKFNGIDKSELSRQVNKVRNYYTSRNRSVLLLPPTFSPDNLEAYLMSNWGQMSDLYEKCFIPWISADIVASGEVAPCHIFYDLILGNLNENSISEIWNGASYKKFREFIERNHFMPICPGCCILYLAGKKLKKNQFKLQN